MSKIFGNSKGAKVRIQAVIQQSGKRPRPVTLAHITVKDPDKWGSGIADTLRKLADEFEKVDEAREIVRSESTVGPDEVILG